MSATQVKATKQSDSTGDVTAKTSASRSSMCKMEFSIAKTDQMRGRQARTSTPAYSGTRVSHKTYMYLDPILNIADNELNVINNQALTATSSSTLKHTMYA